MEKNKSIDGLSPRRPKKTAAKSSVKTPVKPKKKPSPKSSPKPKKVTPPETEKIDQKTVTNPVEDFLKPVEAFNFDAESGELKAAEKTPKQLKKAAKKEKKKLSKKRKIITSIALVIVVLLIGAVIWAILWGNDIIAKITGGQGNILDLLSLTDETYEPLKTDENGRTNILAFGTSGYDMEGSEGNGVHDGAQLTDSIMIISLNQETGDFAMLSLPRDLKASPTCTATGKINEVYWCNNMNGDNEEAGAEALMTEVGSILGIDFQYYAHLNWGALVEIVDVLGGINITLDEGIYDYYYTGAIFEPGVEYTIDGEQALGLARARHGTTDGDFSRGASQQKILIGIKNKIFEKNLSLTDLIDLASTLGDNLRTNFSVEELKSFAHLASDFDFDTMRQISLIEPKRLMTYGTINEISYVIPSAGAGNYGAIQTYVAEMFSNDPRNYEDATILILNGTETPGLASAEQTALEEDGYDNIYIDDAPEDDYDDQYILYSITDAAPGIKRLLEEKYGIFAIPADELPENLPRDYDFIIIIGKQD